nr:reverse transcriptase domain-containing protein [Tanacetum cinerariifolium]
ETFMKRRLKECYELIENMTAYHNDWDTSAQRSESSSSITSSFDTKIAALKAEMTEINKNLMRVLQEDCGLDDSKGESIVSQGSEKEDETDNDVVIEKKTLRGLLNSSYDSDDWTSNFNKPVDIIKECCVEQKESRKDNNNLVASDNVRDKFVNEYAKREECEYRLDVGLEIQTVAAVTKTLPCSSPSVVGANEHTIEGCMQKGVFVFGRCCDLKHVEGLIDKEKGCNRAANGFDVCSQRTYDTSNLGILTYGVKAEQSIRLISDHVPFLSTILSNGSTKKRKIGKIGDSLFPTLGLNRLGDNSRICEPELETLGQILQWLIQNPNMMMTNSGGTPTYSSDQPFTYDMEFEIKMNGLNGNPLIVDLETAKMNEDSLGHLKFDIS